MFKCAKTIKKRNKNRRLSKFLNLIKYNFLLCDEIKSLRKSLQNPLAIWTAVSFAKAFSMITKIFNVKRVQKIDFILLYLILV